jgi:hypothetical protein
MFGPRALLASSITLAALLPFAVACDKTTTTGVSPDKSAATPSASVATTASASAEPTASASASAAPTESATAAASTEPAPHASGTVAATAKKDGGSATPTASGSAGAAECGTKPLPDCPLQAWMKANANPPVMTSNLPGLQTALEKIVTLAPPGYTNWASIAKDGAAAAKSGDLTAAKASCRTCHDQYKQKYKTEMRARKI